ncbi:MAG: hypothetical protein R2784_10385 [Saprospiraceae bacterium]
MDAVKIHVAGNNDWYIKIGGTGPDENITIELADIITKKHYLMAGVIACNRHHFLNQYE